MTKKYKSTLARARREQEAREASAFYAKHPEMHPSYTPPSSRNGSISDEKYASLLEGAMASRQGQTMVRNRDGSWSQSSWLHPAVLNADDVDNDDVCTPPAGAFAYNGESMAAGHIAV